MDRTAQIILSSPILPSGVRRDERGNVLEIVPAELCPELLTADEAIRYLRLDDTAIDDPERTLAYYRKKWRLRATQVGKRLRYRRVELDALLERLTDENPR